jgi:excisionase family DNA binding protein
MAQDKAQRSRRQATTPLFVRIPAEQARRLDRASFELGRPKQALVSALLERYIDPASPASLAALAAPEQRGSAAAAPSQPVSARTEDARRRVTVETLEPDALVVGHHSFRPRERAAAEHDVAEVLTAEQAAELMQVERDVIERLAEAGELPARRLAGQWRFSRAALLDWLAAGAGPVGGGAAAASGGDESGR